MTLLEAISPTARKLLAITKGERRKVHAPTEDHKPLCGGGVWRKISSRLAGGHRRGVLRSLPQHHSATQK